MYDKKHLEVVEKPDMSFMPLNAVKPRWFDQKDSGDRFSKMARGYSKKQPDIRADIPRLLVAQEVTAPFEPEGKT